VKHVLKLTAWRISEVRPIETVCSTPTVAVNHQGCLLCARTLRAQQATDPQGRGAAASLIEDTWDSLETGLEIAGWDGYTPLLEVWAPGLSELFWSRPRYILILRQDRHNLNTNSVTAE
jgi:hypothetical protein